MEEEEEFNDNISPDADNMNPDALDAALGDDFIEMEEEEVIYSFGGDEDDERDLDIAFTDNDSRDWY